MFHLQRVSGIGKKKCLGVELKKSKMWIQPIGHVDLTSTLGIYMDIPLDPSKDSIRLPKHKLQMY